MNIFLMIPIVVTVVVDQALMAILTRRGATRINIEVFMTVKIVRKSVAMMVNCIIFIAKTNK